MQFDELLSDLNDEQKSAVTHESGPLLIVAGAGTGKTTVITRRVAWLILSGRCTTEQVLALTFTEKAAAEMEERVDRILPYGYVDLSLSTFHSFCQTVLRQHSAAIGIPLDFRLLDTTNCWMLVRKHLDRFNLTYYRPRGNPTKFIHALLSHFSRAKDEEITPAQYREYALSKKLDLDTDGALLPDEIQRIGEVADAYHTYEELLLENSCLDFGGLVMATLTLFRTRPSVLQAYREKFRFILVDEFQDTNVTQYELVKLLAAPRNELTVVGDDEQSIYKFRGASLANILEFKHDYPDSREIFLIKNYRSGQAILDAAYICIQYNNPNRLEYQLRAAGDTRLSKKLVSISEESGSVLHMQCQRGDDECETVIREILHLREREHEMSWSDVAILVRAHDTARPFIQKMEDAGIPYHLISQKGLYRKPVILDLLSYGTVLTNLFESAALYRVITYLWKIPERVTMELLHHAHSSGISLWHTLERIDTITNVEGAEKEKIKKHTAWVEKHMQRASALRPHQLLLEIVRDLELMTHLEDDTQQSVETLSNMNQLYHVFRSYCQEDVTMRLADVLALVALEQEAGDEGTIRTEEQGDPDAVRVMTVHGAKGLEFQFVFIVGMVDDRFPTRERSDIIELPLALVRERISEGDHHIEEERRLFYVALTRARRYVMVSSAVEYGGVRRRKPSRFLMEAGILAPDSAGGEKSQTSTTLPYTTPPSRISRAESVSFSLPKVLSYTQLAAFRTCPLQYKFAFLLKIPVFGKPSLSFGRTLHAALYKLYSLIVTRIDTVQTLFPNEKMMYTTNENLLSLEEVFTIYESAWIDEWYPSKKVKDEYYRLGKTILTRVVEEYHSARPTPLYLEKDFVLKEGGVSLKGRIDRIDRLPDGSVEIIDYKTGNPKRAESLDVQAKEQLLIYQIAAQEVFGASVARLTYYYLEDGSKLSFLGSEKDIARVKERIASTAEKIAQGDFSATPGWHCQFCDFRDICEYRKLS